jgi:ribonuclease R
MARVAGADKKGVSKVLSLKSLSAPIPTWLGRLLQENGVWLVVPEDKRFQHDILLAETPAKNLAGQIVSVELLEQPSRYAQPVGKIAEVLGGIDDPGMEIEIAVRKFGVPHVFSDAALDAAAKLPGTVQKKDLKDRVDLRDIPLVTIDGEDARDFDDAVYCEPVKLGRNKAYRLLVAIADVSHYVKPGQPLDRDALLRSTSVYFPAA